jgi:alkanesulfonate monooxygenase SsuD/methylene tetrahydromethanopterin reductase-like flavin-dependent oxidoreductase (luciferase family)
MQFSFFSSTSYMGPAPGMALWPMPPRLCDRSIAGISIARGVETCARADALGYDWVSFSEHHYGVLTLTPVTTVMAAAVSQVVKRAKIAVLGPLLANGNPVRTAEELSLLDHLTDGRLIVLLLQGTPNETRAYEPLDGDSRAITQEGIQLILKAWREGEPFAWKGRHFDFPHVGVWPRPRQEPHPFVFGSGNHDDSARFAARNRLGLAMSFLPLASAAQRIQIYREEADKAGWRPGPEHILYRGIGHLAETDDQAEQEMTEGTERRIATAHQVEMEQHCAPPAGSPEVERAPIFQPLFKGSPRRVIETVRAFHEAGAGTFDVAFHWGATTYEQQVRSMTMFAEHVIPAGRAW